MLTRIDRIFGCLLAIGALLHALGSYQAYREMPQTLLWSLSASALGLLLAGMNVLRTSRPGDGALAALSFAGCMVWLTIVFMFGILIGNVFDHRVLIQASIAIVLAGLSLRDYVKTSASRPASFAMTTSIAMRSPTETSRPQR